MEETACPLCAANAPRLLMEGPDWYYGVPGIFRVVRCGQCGHGYLNPRPADCDLARCYPAGYSAHRPNAANEEAFATKSPPEDRHATRRPWYLSAWMRAIPGPRWLYRWLTDTRSQVVPREATVGRALEYGCATGDFLVRLRSLGWTVEGIELVESAATMARSRGLNVHIGDPTTIHIEPGVYDAVFAWMVIEHLPRPSAALERTFAALRPGGWFCFSVPNFASWERHVWDTHWKGADLPRHLQHFSPARLRSALIDRGFVNVRIIHQPSFLNWLGSHGSWLVSRNPESRTGRRLLQWFYDNPPLWTWFVLGPIAHLLAAVRQSGRLTILAQKPSSQANV
jgi:SAM-dependent methyltransferase